jgi:signal transduction histidine kinase
MFELPKVEWQGSVCRLPLSAAAAAQLVLAVLEEPPHGTQRLSRIVATDAALALWAIFTVPDWQRIPPPEPSDIANWLLQTAIPSGLLEVEQQNATTQPEKCGDDPITCEFSSIPTYPWFPAWLALEPKAGNETRSTTHPTVTSAGDITDSLAVLLPRILSQSRRLQSLENNFGATLEREKIAALRELAYGASHEINNPLANIATRAQTLLREETDPERKRKLATISAQAFRAHEMIADMMLFAKPPLPSFQPTDVIEVVGTVVREVIPDAESQQTEILFEPPSQQIVISADRTQLGVAVKSLVRNALEALASGGTVAIQLQVVTDDNKLKWLDISVRDSGPGISPEVRRHLFDPFYSGREAGRGLGFGLAKTWRIAELHKGSVEVESKLGFGANFVLRIPA